MRYDHFTMLPERAFNKVGGRITYEGGSSPAPAPSNTTNVTTSIPEWAKPYAEKTMGQASALTDLNQNPYQSYGGQKIAGLNPMQQQSYSNIQNMQTSPAVGAGMDISANVAQQAQQYGQYQPQNFGSQFQGADFNPMGIQSYGNVQNPNLQNFQMQQPNDVYCARARSAQLNAAPNFSGMNFQGPQDVSAMQAQGAGLQNYQMGPAQDVSTQNFTNPDVASQYMNPYTQNVVDVQQREAQRAADIAKTGRGAQAVGAGAFGGSRQAIMEAEAARNLATQKGDIQAQGLNAAYNQAQQAFQADQARALQAQQANQQAGLTVGQQNLGANLQTQQLGAGQNLQAQLANQQTGLQAGLANQQMQYNTGLQNAQLGQQAGLANQALQGQYGLQQGQFNQAANLQNAQLRQQAQLANQQAGLTTGQQNLQAMLGVQQLGAGQNLQAQQANQQAALQAQGQGLQQNLAGNAQAMQNAQLAAQYGLAGQQASEQSRQYGANLGLQGLQQQLAAGSQLGNLGQIDYGQNMGINAAQQQAGAGLQSLQQQQLSQNYQDFLNQQRYPYQQLGYMSDILRGIPASASSQSMYQAPASGVNQLASLGLGAYGMNQLFGGTKTSKEGGEIKGYKEGGTIDSYALGGGVGGLGSIPKSSGTTGIEALGLQQQYELALKMPTDQLMAIVNGKPGSIDRSAALTALNLKNKTKVAQDGQQAQQQLAQSKKTVKDSVLDQGIPLLEARNMEDIPSGGIAGQPDEDSGTIAHAASGGQVQHFLVGGLPEEKDKLFSSAWFERLAAPNRKAARPRGMPYTPQLPADVPADVPAAAPAPLTTTPEQLAAQNAGFTQNAAGEPIQTRSNKQRLRTNSDTLDGQPFPPPSPGAIASAEQAAQRQAQSASAPDTSGIAALEQATPASNKPTFGTDYTALLSQQNAVTKDYSDKMAEALKQFTDSGADKEERNRGRKGIMALMAAKELVKPGQTGMQGLGNVFGQIGELANKYDAEDRDDKKKLLGAQMSMYGVQAQLAQGNAKSANDLYTHASREMREYAKMDSEKWYQGEVLKLKQQGMTDEKAHQQALIGAKNRELDIMKDWHDQTIGVQKARIGALSANANTKGQITPALEAKYRSAAIAEVDKRIAGSATERLKVAKDPTYRDTLIDQNIQKILKQGSAASVDNDYTENPPEDATVRR